MRFFAALTALVAGLANANPVPSGEDSSAAIAKRAPGVLGLDVDYTTGAVPWSSLYGSYFYSYIQTTYGMTVTNTVWNTQKTGARAYKFFTGGVHHPDPSVTTATAQAQFFSANGGNWVNDQFTLPGALYLEVNKHNSTVPFCYNLTPAAWPSWIKEFAGAYYAKNGRYPIILTSYNWWKQCTNAYSGFSSVFSIWVINPGGASAAPLPIAWTNWAFWQWATPSAWPGPWNDDWFNGTPATLQTCASTTANC